MSTDPIARNTSNSVRVLVVDDSPTMRRFLAAVLDDDPDIQVIDVASNAQSAREKIKELAPDVLTLDIDMPGMDGLTFLSNLMRLRPMPVVMVSRLIEQGNSIAMRAMELGAVDFLTKPAINDPHDIKRLIDTVKAAARVDMDTMQRAMRETDLVGVCANDVHVPESPVELIAIGASTGGTAAIKQVLMKLPEHTPPIVITQHINEAFVAGFARSLAEHCSLDVMLATDREPLHAGKVVVAPGGRHLAPERVAEGWRCRLCREPTDLPHRPAVDMMFGTIAAEAATSAVGVILTGMGRDGAAGLAEMRTNGARTIAQDRQTSVVWGMPRAATELNAADVVLPLGAIAGTLTRWCDQSARKAQRQRA